MSAVIEPSVAANDELEPSASHASYTISESINDNDAKLDEGLRAPIPIHEENMEDTSLLSDNELEAFVKTKTRRGKLSSIPPNLQHIYQRLSGYQTWSAMTYKKTQKPRTKPKTPSLPPIGSVPLSNQTREISYSEAFSMNDIAEPSPFPINTVTPQPSKPNILDDDFIHSQKRKDTLPFPASPSRSTISGIKNISFTVSKYKDDHDKKQAVNVIEQQAANVKECTMKEIMKIVSNLSSEVIALQQQLYLKDTMIKNLYLRMNEFDHVSFPQLLIERIHITPNRGGGGGGHHTKSSNNHAIRKKNTLSTEESISSYNKDKIDDHKTNNKHHKHRDHMHSTVTLEIVTRWLSRSNISSAIKKGLIFMDKQDIGDVDDYLSNQMWNEWNNSIQKYSISGLDKLKKDDAHQQMINYMQHERVGLVRCEILRGKKYKKYKRIEKPFDSLIFRINDIPKGDTYHITMKVHNPSASIWGPLSNMVSIKVPLKFVDDDDTDNDHDEQHKIKNKHKK